MRLAKQSLSPDVATTSSQSARLAHIMAGGRRRGEGLMVDCTVRCPWHHARFDLRTGEAIAAPALNDVTCWKIEKRENRFFVTSKGEKKSKRKPKSSPASVVIIGAGAAGGAAAEMLRREGYDGAGHLV